MKARAQQKATSNKTGYDQISYKHSPRNPFQTQRRSPFTDQRADKRALQADPTRWRGGTDHGSLRTSPAIQGAVVPAPRRGLAALIALMPHGLMRPHACCAADATAWSLPQARTARCAQELAGQAALSPLIVTGVGRSRPNVE